MSKLSKYHQRVAAEIFAGSFAVGEYPNDKLRSPFEIIESLKTIAKEECPDSSNETIEKMARDTAKVVIDSYWENREEFKRGKE